MKYFKKNIISENFNISDCILHIGKVKIKTLIVTNKNKKLLGTVSDGDIRRGILKFRKLDISVKKIMKKKIFYLIKNKNKKINFEKLKANNILLIPVIDKRKKLLSIQKLEEGLPKKNNISPVLIMAGGLGIRLRPITNRIPKPMIKINGVPILEKIINNFKDDGFKTFYISTFYKSERILNYFKDGSKWGINIKYLNEKFPLGTAGSLSLIPKKEKGPIIIANGDVLTKMSPSSLLDFHKNKNNDLTITSINYNHQLPFGSITIKNNKISKLVEKPETTYKVNAGIYVINKEIYKKVEKNKNISMTELIKKLLLKKKKISVFPIYESWEDLGDKKNLIKLNKENILNL